MRDMETTPEPLGAKVKSIFESVPVTLKVGDAPDMALAIVR